MHFPQVCISGQFGQLSGVIAQRINKTVNRLKIIWWCSASSTVALGALTHRLQCCQDSAQKYNIYISWDLRSKLIIGRYDNCAFRFLSQNLKNFLVPQKWCVFTLVGLWKGTVWQTISWGFLSFEAELSVFSEGYRRYLALGFTSFARTYVSVFAFLFFCLNDQAYNCLIHF